MTNDRRRFYSDLLERVVWTALQSFLGVLIADGLGANIADSAALKVAGLAALISAAKCLLATQVGSSQTAATLPRSDDTPLPAGGTRLLDDGESGLDLLFKVCAAVVAVVLVVYVLRALL